MAQLFVNNATSLTNGALLVGTSTIALASGDGAKFPSPSGGDYFLVTLHLPDYSAWEVVKVATRVGDSFTSIVRGYEGTAKAWDTGTPLSANLTKDTMETIYNSIDDITQTAFAVGGTGSAGAGTQYVTLTINGSTYKLLHDGTV